MITNTMMNYSALAVCVLVLSACLSPVDSDSLKTEVRDVELPIGEFEIVTVRNASDVATTADVASESATLIGAIVNVSADALLMFGRKCEPYVVSSDPASVVNLADPMLADINIAPTDSPRSSGDQRLMQHFTLACEDDKELQVLQVDDRVLVIPWTNASQYLIAEKPLSAAQVMRLQDELRSMKFYSGQSSGQIDDATRQAISRWAEYRADAVDSYAFYRPALTENLLDALSVLETEDQRQ